MATPELLAMLLADARLPTAGHTQSAGLEPAVLGGLAAAEVPEYLAARLATVVRVEAATAVVALHLLREERPLDRLVEEWAARTPSPALRKVSRTQARAVFRLLERLWPHHDVVAAVRRPDLPRPVVLAAAAVVGEIEPVGLARIVGFDDVQSVSSAALKLLPLDPAVTTSWTVAVFDAIESLARDVSPLTDPAAIPTAGAPQFEAWAEAHAVTTRRLFSA